jgi:acetyl-CoA acetyltransferase/uncharacterized OB-fold protein
MTELHVVTPFVAPGNEYFFDQGGDGKLRIKRCQDCGRYVHPPKPICDKCRSFNVVPEVVSGKGILFGYSVNVHFSMPGLPPPPYITGTVSLDEAPYVKVQALITDLDPENVQHGIPVEVTMVATDNDKFVPTFHPVEGEVRELPEDEMTPEDIRALVTPMVSTKKYEYDSIVSGIGMSKVARRQMVDPLGLTVEACLKAIEDAGLTPEDIDGYSSYPGGGLEYGMGEGGFTALEAALRIKPTWFNGGGETFGPGGAMIGAAMAVSSGLVKHVLCFRTLWQSTNETLIREGKIKLGGGQSAHDSAWGVPAGASSASHVLAQHAHRYFDRYGATRETLGWIAINQRTMAGRNPNAIYRDPITMDDYLSARMITTPFGLLDNDVPCDGAIAVIVSTKDYAKDAPKKPVYFEAFGTQLIEPIEWMQSTSWHEPQVIGPAAHMWSRTDLKPADVDVALLYDGFTFNCLSWIEGLGFCEIGEAKDFLDGGKNISLDGLLPLNPHGGQLSAGRTHGMGLFHEAVVQMRGEGGERQVRDARIAVVSSGGLTPSGAILLRNED